MWEQYKGKYRGAHVSVDEGINNWHWTIRMYRPGTKALDLYTHGVADTVEQAEQQMKEYINTYLEETEH